MTTVHTPVHSAVPTASTLPPGVQACLFRTEATMGSRLPSHYVCRDPEGSAPRPLYAEQLAPAQPGSAPSARAERIARLRAQIAAGTYRISAADLADVLIHKLRMGFILR